MPFLCTQRLYFSFPFKKEERHSEKQKYVWTIEPCASTNNNQISSPFIINLKKYYQIFAKKINSTKEKLNHITAFIKLNQIISSVESF